MQIGAELLCKGAKLNTKQVGAWQDRLQSTEYRLRRKGRGVASPRPPMVEVKAYPCPYPRAWLARGDVVGTQCQPYPMQLGQHVVLSLPKALKINGFFAKLARFYSTI